jgi:Ca2+-binding RTX toxin-like protein
VTLLALTACSPGLLLASGQAGGARPCSNRIEGTKANDTLPGTPASDRILGLAGRDRLSGAGAVDCLEGGPDADQLAGEAGRDRLDGGSGNDDLSGGTDADLLEGGAGSDTLAGEAGDDALHGGAGDDRVEEVGDGYRAGETIDVGSNVISGGAGRDTVHAANGRRDRINCGSDKDRVVVDRVDRLKACEKHTFLVSPLPQVSPDRGGRTRSFMVSFRSLGTTDRRTEFFSITVKGPGNCRSITSNSIGVTYHRDGVIRYRLRPFSGAGNAAKRWCPGRYRGSASFVEIVKAGCKSRANREPDRDCTDTRRIGEFSFRVR